MEFPPTCGCRFPNGEQARGHARPVRLRHNPLWLALVVLALAAWLGCQRGNGPGRQGRQPAADLVDDLTLVPANARQVVCLKLASLSRSAAFRRVVSDNRLRETDNADLVTRLERDSGLNHAEVQRCTSVSLGGQPETRWRVVKTSHPYDVQALRYHLRPSEGKTYRGYQMVVGDNARHERVVIGCVSPTIVVIGDEPGVGCALDLLADPVTTGPLAAALDLIRQEHQAVLGYTPARGANVMDLLGINLSGLTDVEIVLGTANLGERLEGDLRLRTASREKAGSTLQEVNGLVKSLGNLLTGSVGRPSGPAEQLNRLLARQEFAVEGNEIVGLLKTDPQTGALLLLRSLLE